MTTILIISCLGHLLNNNATVIHWFQLLKCEVLLYFTILYYWKLHTGIFWFWSFGRIINFKKAKWRCDLGFCKLDVDVMHSFRASNGKQTDNYYLSNNYEVSTDGLLSNLHHTSVEQMSSVSSLVQTKDSVQHGDVPPTGSCKTINQKQRLNPNVTSRTSVVRTLTCSLSSRQLPIAYTSRPYIFLYHNVL